MTIETLLTGLTEAIKENTAALKAHGSVAITLPVGAAAPAVDRRPAAPRTDKNKPAPAAADAPAVTKEDVSKMVTKLGLPGGIGRDATIALLAEFGAKRASDVKPEDYAAFITKGEMALGAGDAAS